MEQHYPLSAIEREYNELNRMLNEGAKNPRYLEIYAAQQALSWAMDSNCAMSPAKYLRGEAPTAALAEPSTVG